MSGVPRFHAERKVDLGAFSSVPSMPSVGRVPDSAVPKETVNVDFAKLTLAQDQEAIVVVFDIRSSSILVSDLTLRNQLDHYVWLVGKMKEHLAKLQMQHNPHGSVFTSSPATAGFCCSPPETVRTKRFLETIL